VKNYLLDFHTLLWLLGDEEKVPAPVRKELAQGTNGLFVSISTVWEINIKVSNGKLTLPSPLEQSWENSLRDMGASLLQTSLPHAVKIRSLPFHHRDPFDRMLIAQCLTEDLTLVSKDEHMDAYGIQRLW
jgi:PIN domain nuclease of toxin-antitoxin system